MSTAPQLVAKLWNYGNVLRDDGRSYGDGLEPLTFLRLPQEADAAERQRAY